METIKFVHFGCWNNLNSKENPTNTEAVLQKLNETVADKSTHTQFIVIAGDNYYPEKRIGENKKKEKIIHKTGEVIEMPYPMNTYYTHSVPACPKDMASVWRISLTFRVIEESFSISNLLE